MTKGGGRLRAKDITDTDISFAFSGFRYLRLVAEDYRRYELVTESA
jgi:hypothetical protein